MHDDDQQQQWQNQQREQQRHDSFLLTLVRQPVLIGTFGVTYFGVYVVHAAHELEWPLKEQTEIAQHSTVGSSGNTFMGTRAGALMGATTTAAASLTEIDLSALMLPYYGPKKV